MINSDFPPLRRCMTSYLEKIHGYQWWWWGGPREINFSLAICMTLIVKWRDVVVSLNLHLTDDGKLNSPAQCQLPLSGDLFLGTLQ